MPPKVKFSREDIVRAALDVIRDTGVFSLNARDIARKLQCSTQPIFSNYATMEALRADVISAAKAHYEMFMKENTQRTDVPLYKANGLAYIEYAKKEKGLFKLLFMRDRSEEQIADARDEAADLVALISRTVGIDAERAYWFHLEMWLYVHGIAVMAATSYLNWESDRIDKMLTDMFTGLSMRYQAERKGSV